MLFRNRGKNCGVFLDTGRQGSHLMGERDGRVGSLRHALWGERGEAPSIGTGEARGQPFGPLAFREPMVADPTPNRGRYLAR